MRLIPARPSRTTQSTAELKVFDRLREVDLGPGWVAFHSVGLPEHPHKRFCEIDFLLLGPSGLFVIEVKGGRIGLQGREWQYQDRTGRIHQDSDGPFKQGRSALYALLGVLEKRDAVARAQVQIWGHAVAFPDCAFAVTSTDWAPCMVLDEQAFMSAATLRGRLQSMIQFFVQKRPRAPELSPTVLKRIETLLAPEFHAVPSLRVAADRMRTEAVRLTDLQYEALSLSLDARPRLLCDGPAGTGKTLVALAAARAQAREGKHVLMLCFNPILAGFLAKETQEPNLVIDSLHSLLTKSIAGTSLKRQLRYSADPLRDPWYRDRLPELFEQACVELPEAPFDVLVVDEAQDILTIAYVSALEKLIRGGYREGRWLFFFDSGLQAGIYGRMDPEVLQYLEGYGPNMVRLKRNCRNTYPIVEATMNMTGSSPGTGGAGEGPPLDVVHYRGEAERVQRLAALIQKYGRQLTPGSVTVLLADGDPQALAARPEMQRLDLRPLDRQRAPSFPAPYPTVCRVDDFKGLENDVIVLDAATDSDLEQDLARLYVGMTRARMLLIFLQNEVTVDGAVNA